MTSDILLKLREAEAALARVKALADEWEQRGEYGDASLTEGARIIHAALNTAPGCCAHCNHGPGFIHHVGCDEGCPT